MQMLVQEKPMRGLIQYLLNLKELGTVLNKF